MNVDDAVYHGFACPQIGFNKPLLEMVVVDHARQTVEAFLRRFSGCFDRSLATVLDGWLSSDVTFSTVWDAAFGEVYGTLLLNDTDNVDQCAAALGLRLHECGCSGDWELPLNSPARFRFGQCLLPPSDAIRVTSSPQAVSVETRNCHVWSHFTFQRRSGGWEGSGVDAVPVLKGNSIRLRVFDYKALTPAGTRLLQRLRFTDEYNSSHGDFALTASRALSTCNAALDLIAERADVYLPWVSYVLRDLITLPPRPGIIDSGSDKVSPGLICLSTPDDHFAIAELLVHEATHQYFYILNRLGPFDDGTDTALYFSPFKHAHRPIAFILLAYHAFGNILLFYRTVRAHDLPARERLQMDLRVKLLEQQLETLEDALRTTKALTPLGHALWQPLFQEIHS